MLYMYMFRVPRSTIEHMDADVLLLTTVLCDRNLKNTSLEVFGLWFRLLNLQGAIKLL